MSTNLPKKTHCLFTTADIFATERLRRVPTGGRDEGHVEKRQCRQKGPVGYIGQSTDEHSHADGRHRQHDDRVGHGLRVVIGDLRDQDEGGEGGA